MPTVSKILAPRDNAHRFPNFIVGILISSSMKAFTKPNKQTTPLSCMNILVAQIHCMDVNHVIVADANGVKDFGTSRQRS